MINPEQLIRDLPDPGAAERFLIELAAKHPQQQRKLEKDAALLSDVLTLASYSPLIAAMLLQHPEYFAWLQRKRSETGIRTKSELLESLARFALTNSQIEPHVVLSRFRRRELLRIYLRDIRRLATVAEVTEEISNLADAVLEHALRVSRQSVDNRFGTPFEQDSKGRTRTAEICVVSLGKLGSLELNYSSDIDLFFIYSDDGSTSGIGERDAVTNREYFIRLAESVTKLVGMQAGEGSAYRVDLRLRPHGRVGPLAMSLAETINYYRREARPWERQVLIRSRASAGSERIFKEFYRSVEDRIFAVGVDVPQALRDVGLSKQKIDLENINARGANVKLGIGGIREIEFISQALQLAYGGEDRWLRSPHTLISLSRLADRKLIDEHELTQLSDAYSFLRRLEHVLQMENGLQTHTVPDDPVRRELAALRLGSKNVADFNDAFHLHTKNVHRVFRRVFAADHIPETADANFHDSHTSTVRIEETAGKVDPEIASLIERAPRLAGSAKLLEAIDLSHLELPERDYSDLLSAAATSDRDLGARLSKLRREWRWLHLEIAAYDGAGKLTISDSKKRQTRLAEASIAAALLIAETESNRRSPESRAPNIGVLGLGKLGGGGIDHDSDLDLVLVHADRAELDPLLDEHSAAIRSAEIFVRALSAMTRDGSLYRVDLRLRPYGKDGDLVIPSGAIEEYFARTSSIWELLAFVKLRAVGGDRVLAEGVESRVRETIFTRARTLRQEDLRDETFRLRKSLEIRHGGRRSGDIDIKFGSGGMLDVYFAVRFLQLKDGIPDDSADRSTARSLELLNSNGSLNSDQFRAFDDGYRFLTELDHYLRLTSGRSSRLPLANSAALELIADRMAINSAQELLECLTAHRLEIEARYLEIMQITSA